MLPLLSNINPLSAGSTKNRSQDQLCGMPRWGWLLGLVLIVVAVGIIIKLWTEEEFDGRRRVTRTTPSPPTPEPTKPVSEAVELEPEIESPVETLAVSPDNLKQVNGIGPKIESLLNENGITTFAQLAETEVSRLQALLVEAGWARLANPTTWPEQARGLAGEK
jgi:predicted flap endonuclease-1-like 5' DNA nuclease